MHTEIVSFQSEELALIPCTKCRKPLNVHQPEAETPERLLGTCEDCGTWYLIEIPMDQPQGKMAELSDIVALLKVPKLA